MIIIVNSNLKRTFRIIQSKWISCNAFRRLSRGYVPNEVEHDVFEFWRSNPLSVSISGDGGGAKFSMVLPPPNVTGTLHLGHALTTTLQDVLAKRSCMNGKRVVWVPGLDHAGIATQAIVELMLSASGLDAKSISRNELLSHINAWTQSKSEVIQSQLKALAPSLDWKRLFFTLDQRQSDAVMEAFCRLYKAGLVYRAERLVNWSVQLGTALSDMEVQYKQISGATQLKLPSFPEPVTFGQMTDVAFQVHNRPDEEIVVSTCRVETMPGDVAVAVHPDDTRYTCYHGQLLVHPLTGQLIPLILDSSADPKFGTGAVKVTPGHDAADFEMALRHGLDIISVIDETGNLNCNAGAFVGLNRFEARRVILDLLKQRGSVRQVRDHTMSIPLCSRTGDVIELISQPQWFIRCKEMGCRALEAVKRGDLEIIPEQHVKHWFSYLENIRDWCVSRQVVWGHRLPLYTDSDGNFHLMSPSEIQLNDDSLNRVPDVLDTWFSSALLPFSVFGWPDEKADLKKYFPLDIMVTGHDILFFWVARMVMLSLQLTDRLPFKKVLLHSVICDPQGRKMSKSLGNVIDPQHVIQGISHQELMKDIEDREERGLLKSEEAALARQNVGLKFPVGIPQCGSDSLRLSLLSHRIKNHYVDFDVDACHTNKLFCNKLWQASRFISDWASKLLDDHSVEREPVSQRKLDLWLLGKLSSTVETADKALDSYDFHVAVSSIKYFVQQVLCDVYLEAVKSKLKTPDKSEAGEICYTMLFCLVSVVKMLAPIAPFISEKLYQHLQPHVQRSVHQSTWPSHSCLTVRLPAATFTQIDEEISQCLSIVKEIRRMKLNLDEKSSKTIVVGVKMNSESKLSSELFEMMEDLSRCRIQLLSSADLTDWVLFSTLSQDVSVYHLQRNSKADSVAPEKATDYTFKLKKMEKELERIMKMMSHDSYRTKVEESVQRSHSDKILRLQVEIQQLRSQT